MSRLPSSAGAEHHDQTHLNSVKTETHARLHHASAPLPFFHATRAEGRLLSSSPSDHHQDSTTTSTVDNQADKDRDSDIRWRSRASRKRLYERKPVSVQHDHRPSRSAGGAGTRDPQQPATGNATTGVGEKREPWSAELRVHKKAQQQHWHGMHFRLTGDVSFWVAVIFVLGSIAWVRTFFILLFFFFCVRRWTLDVRISISIYLTRDATNTDERYSVHVQYCQRRRSSTVSSSSCHW